MRVAFISGITGQDGSLLTELLLEQGYAVHGMVRRSSSLERSRLKHLYADPSVYGQTLHLHYSDLSDATTMRRLLMKCLPDEVYHLAGPSHVGISFETPESTCEMNAMGTLRLLEILRDLPKPARFYNASSSEVFGNPIQAPQDEATPMNPTSPYGVAKAFATQMTRVYRQCFGVFACNGIAYNHESIRRGENFITRKVCRAAAAISLGLQKTLTLGDLDAKRDWGYAPDYVKAMWLALQHEEAGDYILATGVQHAVRDLVEIAFSCVGLEWEKHIRQDPAYMRPSDPSRLVGSPAKAEQVLGWRRTMNFPDVVRRMVSNDLEELGRSARET